MKNLTMWILFGTLGMVGCGDAETAQLSSALSGEMSLDDPIQDGTCGPGSTYRTCPHAGPAAPTVPGRTSCTPENSLFAGIRTDENNQPLSEPPGFARLRLSYLPLEPIRDDFVANGKYMSYDDSEVHGCRWPTQNGSPWMYWMPPGRYRFGVTYQPQVTEEVELVADQCYEIRMQGHVGSLSATVGPCTEPAAPPAGN